MDERSTTTGAESVAEPCCDDCASEATGTSCPSGRPAAADTAGREPPLRASEGVRAFHERLLEDRRMASRTPVPREIVASRRTTWSVRSIRSRWGTGLGARETENLLQQAKRPSVADALADPCQAYVRRIRLEGALKVVEEEVTCARSTSLREDLDHFSALQARIDEPPPTETREGLQPSRADHEGATPGSTRHDGADFWICTEAMDAVYDPAGRGCGWLDDARGASGIQQFRATSFGSIEGGNPGWGASGARRSERVIGLHDAEVPDDWSTWAVLGSSSAGSRVWNLFEAPSSQSAHGVSMASVMVADGRKDREVDVDWHTGMARSAGVAVYDDATTDDLESGGPSAVRGLAGSDVFVSARSTYLDAEPDGYASAVFKPLCGGPSSSATEEGSDKAEEDFRCNHWGKHEREGPGRAYADQVDATFAESGLQVFFSAGNVAGNCYSEDRYSIPLGRSAFSSIAAGAVYSTPYQADLGAA